MPSFRETLNAHLATYKRHRLRVLDDGVWRSNGRPYPHILPESEYRLNVLETIRDDFWRYFDASPATRATHTDFHHLNSSQAFAFNLLYPFLAEPGDGARALLDAFGIEGGIVQSWDFEAMPDGDERTSFDLMLTLSDGRRIFVEVKLTEANFGSCIPKDSHRLKLERTYRPRLADKLANPSVDEGTFFTHYQLFRNLSHVDPSRGDELVLLVPRANATAWAEAQAFVATYVASSLRSRVRLVAGEDVIAAFERCAHTDVARQHVALLREKYAFETNPDR